MADPTRLLDDPNAPDEAVALLRSLRGPEPFTDEARAGIASRVAATVANAPVATAAAKATPLKLAALSGAIIVGIGAVVLVVTLSRSAPPEPPRAPPPAAPPVPAEAAPVPPPVSPNAAAPMPEPKAEERTAPRASARDSLALEEALLEQARKAASSSPSRALSLLKEHERRFPHGELSAERLFLSAKVYSQTGNRGAALRYAGELKARFPSSSYNTRLKAILGEPKAP